MKDYIVRATAAGGQVRAFAAVTKDIVEEARKHHETSPVATAALGRLLTAGALMGSMMKNETDMLTLQVRGDGPLGGIVSVISSPVLPRSSSSRFSGVYPFSNKLVTEVTFFRFSSICAIVFSSANGII